jgi:hypothetical protein
LPGILQPLGPDAIVHLVERVQSALAGRPHDVPFALINFVSPLLDLNGQIQEMTTTLATAELAPLARASLEVQRAGLDEFRRNLRHNLDSFLGLPSQPSHP